MDLRIKGLRHPEISMQRKSKMAEDVLGKSVKQLKTVLSLSLLSK